MHTALSKHKKSNLNCFILTGLVTVFFASPLSNVHAEFSFLPKIEKNQSYSLVSAQSTKKSITYSGVSLSEINRDISSSLGSSKILVPASGVIDTNNSIYIPETDSLIRTATRTKNEFWIDSDLKFKTYNEQGAEIYVEDLFKKDPSVVNTKMKSGKFQGSTKNPTLSLSWFAHNDIGGGKFDDSHAFYSVLIYDSSTEEVIVIMYDSLKDTKIISDKIWKTVLKSITDKPKISTKKQSVSKEKNLIDETRFNNNLFSINFPKGWAVESDAESVVAVAHNLGASILVSIRKTDKGIEYDPSMINFWTELFKKEYKSILSDFNFISSKNVKLGNDDFLRLDYTTTVDNLPVIGYQLFSIEDTYESVITVTFMNKTQERNYSNIIEKSTSTFKINNK